MPAGKHGINLVRVDTTDSDRRKKLWLVLTVSLVVMLAVLVVNVGIFGYTVIQKQQVTKISQSIKSVKNDINRLSKVESLHTVLVNQVRATGDLLDKRGDVVTPMEVLLTTINGRSHEVLVENIMVENEQTLTFSAQVRNSKALTGLLEEVVERLVTIGYGEARISDVTESADGLFQVSIAYAD